MKQAAININFDSLKEAFGYPKGFKDPCFFVGFDRLMELAEKYNFKYSIFVIGRDLEDPEIFARVREWSSLGHEIGNHSWSHHMDIGALKKNDIEQEVLRSHEIITRCTGKEPKGFMAPGWSISKELVSVLSENKYLYDASLIPSFSVYLIAGKIALNHLNNREKMKRILNRKDLTFLLKYPKTPFMMDSLLILPMPVLSKASIPFWHSLGFAFGWKRTFRNLKKHLKKVDYFYYLLHPADIIDSNDFEEDYPNSLERLNISFKEKMQVLDSAFNIINSERKIVKMEELAHEIYSKKISC